MNLNNFDKVSVTQKVYNVNLDTEKDLSDNIFCKYTKKNLVASLINTGATIPSHIAPIEIFFVNEYFFIYSTDRIYRNINLTTNKIIESSKLYSGYLRVVPFRYKGVDETLIYSKDNYHVWLKTQPKFDLPDGDYSIFHANILFIAKGRNLYYGDFFNKVVDNVEYTFDYSFTSSLSDGEIVGLMSLKDSLYVICQHSIFKFQNFDNYYNLKITKLAMPFLDIVKKSFCDISNEGYFISSNKLFKLSNDKVELVNCYINDKSYSIISKSFQCDGKYMVPIEINSKQFTYCFDTITKLECQFEYRKYFCDKYGYALKDNFIYCVQFSYEDCVGKPWKSIPLDLGSCNVKTVVEIQAEVSGNANLRLSGDYTDKIIVLNSGCNLKKCNLTSKKFIINIENPSIDFYIKSLKIKYI